MNTSIWFHQQLVFLVLLMLKRKLATLGKKEKWLNAWHFGAGPVQSQNGCSFVPHSWQTYCIALCVLWKQQEVAGGEFKGHLVFAVESDWLLAHLVTGQSTLGRLCGSRALPSSDVSISLLFRTSPTLGKRAIACSASRENSVCMHSIHSSVRERVHAVDLQWIFSHPL